MHFRYISIRIIIAISFNCDNIASSELVDQALEKAFNDIMKVAEDGMKNITEVFPEATPIISDGELFNHIVAKAKEREEESHQQNRHPRRPAKNSLGSVDIDLSESDKVTRLSLEGQRSDEDSQFINPFFHVFSIKKILKIKHNSFRIHRLVGNTNNFETSIMWSYKNFPEIYEAKFKDTSIDNNIELFRRLVGLHALAEMLNVEICVCSKQELNSDFLQKTLCSILEVKNENLPKDIGYKLQTYCAQLSMNYSSSLNEFLQTSFATAELVYEFWNKAFICSNEVLGHSFCDIASILLQIGIAVWTPDEATPGNYLLSQLFGESFKDTIHLVSHTEDLDVETQRSTRYINFLVCKH